MGLEPTPGPWQGPVLPLYYGRPNQQNSNTPAIRGQDPSVAESPMSSRIHPYPSRNFVWQPLNGPKAVESADLQYPGGLYNWGLPLPLGEFSGLFPVRVHASKPFTVFIKHGDLPVPVLPPPIFSELGAFPCGLCLGHSLNISMGVRVRKYQFNQYFARDEIILYYPLSCNEERQLARKRSEPPANHACKLRSLAFVRQMNIIRILE
jgi:hypothetical protein